MASRASARLASTDANMSGTPPRWGRCLPPQGGGDERGRRRQKRYRHRGRQTTRQLASAPSRSDEPSIASPRRASSLELLTQCVCAGEGFEADEAAADFEERFVDVVAAFVADAEPAVLVQPGERALDDPALAAEPGAVRTLGLGDPGTDASGAQCAAVASWSGRRDRRATVSVVAAVGRVCRAPAGCRRRAAVSGSRR